MKLKIYILILLLVNCLHSFSQTQTWVWAKGAIGDSSDYGRCLTTDDAGNVYIGGYFFSPELIFGNDTLRNGTASSDIYLAKFDTAGNPLWARSAGTPNDDQGESVACDAAGNVYYTGYFGDSIIVFGQDTLYNNDFAIQNDNFFIVKYDTSGNVIWARSGGGNSTDEAKSIACDAAGNIFIAGEYLSDTVMIGSDTLVRRGSLTDIFIAKYDSSGNPVWAKSAGGMNTSESCRGISMDAASNVYITGDFPSQMIFDSDTLTNPGPGSNHLFIASYDSTGNYRWAENTGADVSVYGASIATDTTGNSYITGSFNGSQIIFGTDTLLNLDDDDMFIAKYNSVGIVQWAKSGGGAQFDRGQSIVTDPQGFIYVTGTSLSSSFVLENDTLSGSGSGSFLAKLHPGGNIPWKMLTEGTSNALSSDHFNNIFYTGNYATQTITFGNHSISNSNSSSPFNSDLFLAKLYQCYSSTSNLNTNACRTYLSPSGNHTWITSGIYNDTIQNAGGCDSIITINLLITDIDTTVSQAGISLTSNESGAHYQWLDCNSGFAVLPGDTNKTFIATINGNYAVAITLNGCSDTSDCYSITNVGMDDFASSASIQVYPNPAKGNITIEASAGIEEIEITNLLGVLMYRANHFSKRATVKLDVAGVYFVKVTVSGRTLTRRLVVPE